MQKTWLFIDSYCIASTIMKYVKKITKYPNIVPCHNSTIYLLRFFVFVWHESSAQSTNWLIWLDLRNIILCKNNNLCEFNFSCNVTSTFCLFAFFSFWYYLIFIEPLIYIHYMCLLFVVDLSIFEWGKIK